MSADTGLICCSVGSSQYAFRAADVRHVARIEHMRAGTSADGRSGVLNINGQHVPVFHLAGVIGQPVDETASRRKDQHIAVTGDADEMVGWLVDRMARTSIAAATAIVPLPGLIGAPATAWFDAMINLGDTSVLRLSPRHLNPRSAHRLVPGAPDAPAPAPAAAVRRRHEPLVILFSTSALPQGPAGRYALSAGQIAAISQPMPITTVPGSSRHVVGLSWWRHTVVPVVDFRDHDAQAAAPHRRCLIARGGWRSGGALIALPIDPEIAVHKPSGADHRLTDTTSPRFAAGLFRAGADTVTLLDLDALLLTSH